MCKTNLEKSEIYGSIDIFWHLAIQPLGNISHVAASRSSSKNTRKLNIRSRGESLSRAMAHS
jgi:hypothetical protein